MNDFLQTKTWVRAPFYVEAIQVDASNMEEVAKWCKGTIVTPPEGDRHIQVRVFRPMNDRQTKAFVGDWVLHAGKGFKVYTNKAFLDNFLEFEGVAFWEGSAPSLSTPDETK